MDLYISQIFSVIVDDFILLYDTYTLSNNYYYNVVIDNNTNNEKTFHNQRKFNLQDLTNCLAYVATTEHNQRITNDYYTLNEFDITKKSSAKEELWDFIRFVIISFPFDVLSQYPFWYIKVKLCSSQEIILQTSNDNIILTFANSLYQYYKHNQLHELLYGSLPYLIAGFFQNWNSLKIKFTNAIGAIMSKLPVNTSTYSILSRLNSSTSSIGHFLHSRNTNNKNVSKEKESNRKNSFTTSSINLSNLSLLNYDDELKSLPTSMSYDNWDSDLVINKNDNNNLVESRIQRLIRKAFMHPFILLSCNMAANPFVYNNCSNSISALFYMIKRYGYRSLTNGIRVNLVFSLLRYIPVWSYGFYDTILYRCMLDQEHRLGIWRVVDIILRNKETTVDKTSDAISNSLHLSDISLSGIESVFRFGLLSVAQFIPGLTVFVLLRGVSWILTGSSNYRIRQIRNRKQILDNYWRRKYVIRNDST